MSSIPPQALIPTRPARSQATRIAALLLAALAPFTAAGPASAQPARPPAKLPAGAASPAATAKPHPLLGAWGWRFKGASGQLCTETLEFRADGTRVSTSGDETNEASYSPTAVPSLLGFYRLDETVTRSSGKPDCAGDQHPVTGEPRQRFIQFDPKMELLIVCRTESLEACYGPMARLKK